MVATKSNPDRYTIRISKESRPVPLPRKKCLRKLSQPKKADVTVHPVNSREGWATKEGFTRTLTKVNPKTELPLEKGGVVLASCEDEAWIDTSDSHTVVIGSTGSMKSRSVCMPTMVACIRASQSLLVSDCKGELLSEMRPLLEQYGYDVYNFNLRDPSYSNGWNPLTIPYCLYRSKDPKDVSKGLDMVYELADLMSPIEGKDPYWDQSGRDTIAGAILFMFDNCDDMDLVNLTGIQSVITMISDRDSPIYEIVSSLETDDPVYACLSGALFNSESTQRCILGMARKSIRPFVSNPLISSILSDPEIDPSELSEGRTAIFITVPDDRETYNMLVSTFIKQTYSTLVDIADSTYNRRLKNSVTFVLDEFGSFPAIPGMSSVITAARSRSIRFLMVLQGMDQLSYRYGPEVASTILGNCSNLIFINSRERNLLSYISYLVGEDRDRKPLISTSRLQRLDKESGEMLVFHDRGYPYISHLMDISRYGLPKGTYGNTRIEHPPTQVFKLDSKEQGCLGLFRSLGLDDE